MNAVTRSFLLSGCVVLIGACETINTRSDYDHSVDFSGYDSFAWISDKPMVVASPEVSPLAQSRIQNAIRRTLESKGMRFVEDATDADFVVGFTVGTRQQVRVDTTPIYPYPAGYRGPYRWGYPYYQDVDVREYTQGRLAIDVFDAAEKQPVWHGFATKNITGADQADPEPLITKAVEAILKDFPPGTAS